MKLLRKHAFPSGTFAALVLMSARNLTTAARAFGASWSGTIHRTVFAVIANTIFDEYWLVSDLVTTSFDYPTGFVIKSGSAPVVSGQLGCIITVHGYLTAA